MWTPRRLVLLMAGVAAFTVVYAAYAQVLGPIDGLPPLPIAYFERRAPDAADDVFKPKDTYIDVKLNRAFGGGCLETGYNHRLELQKSGVILATNQLTIEPDGRCKLKPFSVAVMKERGQGHEPEISTIHADEALVLFDKPVKSLSEMGQRRIVGCDLVSDPGLLSPDPRRHRVTCHNNRGSSSPDDDLIIETVGPVVYRELPQPEPPILTAPPQVITSAVVKLVERRGAAQATTVTAQGMKLFLASTPPPPAGAPKAKGKSGNMAGVRKIVLPESVTMNLWVDPKDGFLATGRPNAAGAGAASRPAEQTNVQITTPGQFAYEIGPDYDTAQFDMKPAAAPGEQPGYVQVVRPLLQGEQTLYDRLDCDTLELRFGRQTAKASAPKKAEPGNNLQWVKARGQYVVLTSQAENLQAHGNELHYDAVTKSTTLKGKPEVVANKDGHEIHAPEVTLVNAGGKSGSEAHAKGAGYFKGQFTGNPGGPDGPRALTAKWHDSLHYRKDEHQELITLKGAATVIDPERQQTLAGDQIKLTLAPVPAAAQKPPSERRAKPRRLEVTGNVSAQAPDLVVKNTELLVVLFTDVAGERPAAAVVTPKVAAAPAAASTPAPAPGPATPPVAKPPAKPPLELTAKSVQAFMLSYASGPTELDNVNCEGRVVVHQDPTAPQTKPVEMRGDLLKLTRRPEGSLVTVTGDVDRPAEVHLPELSLFGPTIKLDQVANRADVEGRGEMRIVSATDFEGKKLEKPTELQIMWRDEMHFNGVIANFSGDVQAVQDNTRMLCHAMQVTLDKPVKFDQKPGEPKENAKSANVQKVVCSTTGADGADPISVVDSFKDTTGRIIRYQRIDARELDVFKDEGRFEAPGPGEVRILQLGPKSLDPAPAGPKPAPGSAAEEMKLTYVRYDHKMTVRHEQRIARFWKNVEVLHLPADNPGLHMDFNRLINNLPSGALYLKSDVLTVYSEDRGAKKNHILHAEQRASVQFDNVYGQADHIKYNEELQQVIFEGSPGRLAVLTKSKGKGQEPQRFQGDKFIYNRATGTFTGTGIRSFSGN